MNKLNQCLSIEKGIRTSSRNTLTELHKASQKADLMNGHVRSYSPAFEEGEDYPDERRNVQFKFRDVFSQVESCMGELFNVTAIKDIANCEAKADVMLEGRAIIPQAPVTYLLFLEKQLTDLHTFVSKVVELNGNDVWHYDENEGCMVSSPVRMQKKQKDKVPVTLAPPTKEHPAQVELVDREVVVGHWDTTKYSGAIPRQRKKEILDRITKLANAVKCAREQANCYEIKEQPNIGKVVFEYLFH